MGRESRRRRAGERVRLRRSRASAIRRQGVGGRL